MAYLLDPAEGKYLLDDLALRYLSIELRSPDAVEGTLDFGGDQESERTGRQAAALLLLVDRLREALDARELTPLYERFERPLVRVLARMEAAGVAIDLAFLDELSAELGESVPRARGEDPRAHGRDVQRQLDTADAAHPVRRCSGSRR